jgi:DNA repair protein RadC
MTSLALQDDFFTPVAAPESVGRRSAQRAASQLAVQYGYRLVRDGTMSAGVVCEGRPERVTFREAKDIYNFMAPVAALEPNEVLWMLPLDAQHRLCPSGFIAVSRGVLNSALVHPREIFLGAIVAHAYAIVLCHNHPSGDPSPSPEDRIVTQKLVTAGRMLDIEVLDHLIIGDGRYISFAESGILV